MAFSAAAFVTVSVAGEGPTPEGPGGITGSSSCVLGLSLVILRVAFVAGLGLLRRYPARDTGWSQACFGRVKNFRDGSLTFEGPRKTTQALDSNFIKTLANFYKS
ncbi:hypothetical protein ACRB8A_04430 [Arthrobacter sp. G.S.26]|uniref:hypothetical protein n=1 Tax=unclassified Arthrobacter TaxID=235627 RepID=UPI0018D0B948|nr:hypothetical protein [Arthrobacter sp. ZBG10]